MPTYDDSTVITPFRDILNRYQLRTYRVADLNALDTLIGMETGSLAVVLSGNALFEYVAGGWRQLTESVFATTALRDAAYALAAGAYAVLGARSRVTGTGITYRHNGTAWKAWESDWITYAPALTNMTLGTGGVSTWAYKYVSGDIRVKGSVKFGTGGGATGAVGIAVDLPVAQPVGTHAFEVMQGNGVLYDDSAATPYLVGIGRDAAATTRFRFYPHNSGAVTTAIGATVPFTWAINDAISAEFIYRPV